MPQSQDETDQEQSMLTKYAQFMTNYNQHITVLVLVPSSCLHQRHKKNMNDWTWISKRGAPGDCQWLWQIKICFLQFWKGNFLLWKVNFYAYFPQWQVMSKVSVEPWMLDICGIFDMIIKVEKIYVYNISAQLWGQRIDNYFDHLSYC